MKDKYKNKHLVFIISNFNFAGGYEIRYLKLAYFLHNKGYKVSIIMHPALFVNLKNKTVISILSDENFLLRVHKIEFPLGNLLFKPYNYIMYNLFGINGFLYLCINKLEEIGADLVYTNSDVATLKLLAKKNKRIKIIKDFISPDHVDKLVNSKSYKYIKYIDIITFVSSSVEKRFKNKIKYLVPPDEIPTVITAPVPFFYSKENAININYKEKDNIMIYAHRLIDRKNPVLFAHLVKKMCLDSEFDNWNFCLFGKGNKEGEVLKLLTEEIFKKRVQVGHKSNLMDYLKKSKIFFSLIEPDSFPSQSVMEAMSYGNSIIVLNTGNSKFFVENNGLVVEKDVDLILSKLKYYIYKDLEQKGINSVTLLKNRISIDKYLEYINSIYKMSFLL